MHESSWPVDMTSHFSRPYSKLRIPYPVTMRVKHAAITGWFKAPFVRFTSFHLPVICNILLYYSIILNYMSYHK